MRPVALTYLVSTAVLLPLMGCGSESTDNRKRTPSSGDNTVFGDGANAGDVGGGDPMVGVDHGGVLHNDDMAGVWHAPGKTDPLGNCTECHGATLRGGTGSSCYNCHNDNDHASSRGGVLHKSGSSSTCDDCHGPGNGGGLGPACSSCH